MFSKSGYQVSWKVGQLPLAGSSLRVQSRCGLVLETCEGTGSGVGWVSSEPFQAVNSFFFFFLILNVGFFFFLFTYLFIIILAALGLHCCTQAFSSCDEQGLLFVSVRGLLIAVASLAAEHGL